MESDVGSKRFINKKNLIIASLLLVIVCVVLAKFYKTVTIAFDGREIQVSTFSSTVVGVLRGQGIEVHEEDKVVPQLHEKISEGMRITIHRAFEIKLIDGGKEQNILTAEKTVEDLLRSLDIHIDENDKVQPDLSTPIMKGDEIQITRVEEEVVTETQDIPFQTVVKYSESLDYGESRKVQEGQKGLKEIEYKVVYEDGVEVAREMLREIVHRTAVNEIIERATLNYIVTSRGEVKRYKKVYIMEATAYDAGYESTGKRPGDPYYGITRSGTKVRPGVVAVDPKVIPLGSKLYIESIDGTKSYGFASAEDTGSAIKGNRIDLYYESRQEALKFGRRKVKVYVLE